MESHSSFRPLLWFALPQRSGRIAVTFEQIMQSKISYGFKISLFYLILFFFPVTQFQSFIVDRQHNQHRQTKDKVQLLFNIEKRPHQSLQIAQTVYSKLLSGHPGLILVVEGTKDNIEHRQDSLGVTRFGIRNKKQLKKRSLGYWPAAHIMSSVRFYKGSGHDMFYYFIHSSFVCFRCILSVKHSVDPTTKFKQALDSIFYWDPLYIFLLTPMIYAEINQLQLRFHSHRWRTLPVCNPALTPSKPQNYVSGEHSWAQPVDSIHENCPKCYTFRYGKNQRHSTFIERMIS